jgi:predicted RNase H-like nuclease (RuvC/YqgF family)
MSKIPESYYFYKDQLRIAREEKEKLKKEYDSKITGLDGEISFLKEQIQSQHTMIEQSIEYVLRLEQQLKSFDMELSSDKKKL